MRWYWHWHERGERRTKRIFALIPRRDPKTGLVYWLEWVDLVQEYRFSCKGKGGSYWYTLEVR